MRLCRGPTSALLFGLIAAGVSGASASAPELRRVAGKVVMEHSICGGGAAIRPEDIERLPPPYPLGGKEFLVVAGEQISATRPVARFVTRPDGTFVTRLPPGTWCFFEAARRPSLPRGRPGEPEALAPPVAPSPHADADCLEAERRRCDLVLPVKSAVRPVQITFNARCPEPWAEPCYRGPMPP